MSLRFVKKILSIALSFVLGVTIVLSLAACGVGNSFVPGLVTAPAVQKVDTTKISDDTADATMLWLLDSGAKLGVPLRSRYVITGGAGNRVLKVDYGGKGPIQVTIMFENGDIGLVTYRLSKDGILPAIEGRVLLGEPTLSSDKKLLLFPVKSVEAGAAFVCIRASDYENKLCIQTAEMPTIIQLPKPAGDLNPSMFVTNDTRI